MAARNTDIECGFCLRKNRDLEEPKALPCGHPHCLTCLSEYYEVKHLVECPLQTCRQVLKDIWLNPVIDAK